MDRDLQVVLVVLLQLRELYTHLEAVVVVIPMELLEEEVAEALEVQHLEVL
jgi:hypothetical protein